LEFPVPALSFIISILLLLLACSQVLLPVSFLLLFVFGEQQVIDRRLYRRKYDAAKVVEAFSATLRYEVDLSQLREHLISVVQETMQPTHVSLWLRPPERDNK
jgi:hypothetical protein